MGNSSNSRLLSIGEFAAATQLTAKAVRLYDEQGLLRPATTDPSNGYRYYQADQVPTGRLIRALRDMNLSLSQIDQVLNAGRGHRELLLREFLRDAERRLAHERAAYQKALLALNSRMTVQASTVIETSLPDQTISVWQFTSDRRTFHERYLDRMRTAASQLAAGGIAITDSGSCVLLEPLTDEEANLEFQLPIRLEEQQPRSNMTIRHLTTRRCASVEALASSAHEGFTSAVDALFDWFDRHGLHPLGNPEVVRNDDATVNVRWTISGDSP